MFHKRRNSLHHTSELSEKQRLVKFITPKTIFSVSALYAPRGWKENKNKIPFLYRKKWIVY
jgi:hypothetical protein